MNPIRLQVQANLETISANSFRSKISETIGDIEVSRCQLIFPPDCWQNARETGFDFNFVLDELVDNVFIFLNRIMVDSNLRIQEIEFSGLWRLQGPTHPFGLGLDIRRLQGESGDVVYNSAVSANENSFAKSFREGVCNRFDEISQLLSPWQMCTGGICKVNQGMTPLEKEHRNHLHLTFKS